LITDDAGRLAYALIKQLQKYSTNISPLNLHLSNLTPSEHQSSVAVDITNRNVAEQMETQSI